MVTKIEVLESIFQNLFTTSAASTNIKAYSNIYNSLGSLDSSSGTFLKGIITYPTNISKGVNYKEVVHQLLIEADSSASLDTFIKELEEYSFDANNGYDPLIMSDIVGYIDFDNLDENIAEENITVNRDDSIYAYSTNEGSTWIDASSSTAYICDSYRRTDITPNRIYKIMPMISLTPTEYAGSSRLKFDLYFTWLSELAGLTRTFKFIAFYSASDNHLLSEQQTIRTNYDSYENYVEIEVTFPTEAPTDNIYHFESDALYIDLPANSGELTYLCLFGKDLTSSEISTTQTIIEILTSSISFNQYYYTFESELIPYYIEIIELERNVDNTAILQIKARYER